MTKSLLKSIKRKGTGNKKRIGGRKNMEKGLRQDKRWYMNAKEGKEGDKKSEVKGIQEDRAAL